MNKFKGLTWDHPRGYRPLQSWAAKDQAVDVEWHIQKLEGFESHPINELAESYDLLVVDNPGIGEAVEKQCLHPLEDFLTTKQIDFLRQSSVGASFDSYQYQGKHWAIPIDAASQVCAVAGEAVINPPETWEAVQAYSRRHKNCVALSLGGPHALLTLYSISQALGSEIFTDNNFIMSREITIRAIDIMKNIFSNQQKKFVSLNPISLLDAMAQGDFDLCPAIFGYINYSNPNSGRAIHFVDIPYAKSSSLRGSVLGGTGLAISVHCTPTPALINHIMGYVSDKTQTTLVVENGGQPSNIHAWHDAQANKLKQHFFSNTFKTVSGAYVRPKYDGYIEFQDSSSELIREGLLNQMAASQIFDAIAENYSRHRP